MNEEAGPSNEYLQLEPGSEWRFELEADESIAIRVSLNSLDSLHSCVFERNSLGTQTNYLE